MAEHIAGHSSNEPLLGVRMKVLNVDPKIYNAAQDRMAMLPNYYRWIYWRFKKYMSGVLVELGCGRGYLIRHYLKRVGQVIAVDSNRLLVDQIRRDYSQRRVDAVCADLNGDWKELSGVKADVVLLADVLEHIQDDLGFVRKLTNILKPGGKALIKVPAQSSLYAEMDEASGHYRRYDKPVLKHVMESAGFKTIRLDFMNPLGAYAYRLKNKRKVTYSDAYTPGMLKLINAAIPLLALWDALPAVKGLSLIGVFEVSTGLLPKGGRPR